MSLTNGAASTANVDMPLLSTLQANYTEYRPHLELLWLLLTYTPYLPQAMRFTSFKQSRARKYPPVVMLVHILTSLMLVLRYHARYAATHVWPRPETQDLVLFAAFIVTSVILQAAKSAAPLASPARRSGFQAAVFIQAIVFGASWIRGGDPVLFRASIKFLNWFASFRTLSRWLARIDPSLKNDSVLLSSTTVLFSGAFAMWEAGIPAGVPAFLGLAAVHMVVERAVAEAIYGIPDGSVLKRVVLASGYVDHNLLRQKVKEADGKLADVDEEKVEL